ncbi:rolling circle replication-associated protein, partial [Tenacibaculum piscium]
SKRGRKFGVPAPVDSPDVSFKDLGTMSKAQQRKAKKAIECLVNMVSFSGRQKKQYLAFVTLTLPSVQVSSDTAIRKLLARYIENLTKTYGVEHWVWKAEPQKNGNIHFHLIIDKFLEWSIHRKIWNSQLDKLGYLDAFCNKHGHRNPNTVDVHSLKDKNCASSYLLKYMTKLETGKRPILGAIWGASNATKKLEYPRFSEGNQGFETVMDSLSAPEFKKVVAEEYYAHFVGKPFVYFSDLKRKTRTVWRLVKDWFFTLNGLFTAPPVVPKEFVRVPRAYRVGSYETHEESIQRINKAKRLRSDNLRKIKENALKLVTYDPYKANQLHFFPPL